MTTKDKLVVIGWLFLLLALIAVGMYVTYTYVYPWILNAERRAVEYSDSFVDSTNIAMMNLIAEYEGSNNEAQKKTILNQICLKYVTMPAEVINQGI